MINLSQDFTRVGGASNAMKEKHPEKRSWWVDPRGKVWDAGHDHNKFLEEHPKTFGKYADIDKALTLNWVRVAFWGGQYIVHCHQINPAQVTAVQKIYRGVSQGATIYISTLNKYGYTSREDFLTADSQGGLIRTLFKDPVSVASNRRLKPHLPSIRTRR